MHRRGSRTRADWAAARSLKGASWPLPEECPLLGSEDASQVFIAGKVEEFLRRGMDMP